MAWMGPKQQLRLLVTSEAPGTSAWAQQGSEARGGAHFHLHLPRGASRLPRPLSF